MPLHHLTFFLLIIFLFDITRLIQAQTKNDSDRKKIGLVLSGGGAKGLAHVGALKVLEENRIPIDYIVGTSMGGIVGGLYAVGYTANEIEQLVKRPDFQDWAKGKLGTNEKYLYERPQQDPSFFSLQINLDSNFQATLPSNLVNDAPLNFALAQYFHKASYQAGYDFDSLSIPFRCMGAEIFTQKEVILKKGNLSEAVRATMAVPLFFRPVKIDGQYIFDGGLYNNFPVDVMRQEFSPDVVIGVNVSSKVYPEYPYEDDEQLIQNALKFTLMDNSDPSQLGEVDIYIGVDVDAYSPLQFEEVDTLVSLGRIAIEQKLTELKQKIPITLNSPRASRWEELTDFDKKRLTQVQINGLTNRQQKYVRRLIQPRKRVRQSINQTKEGYYLLISDNYFKDVYPRIVHDTLEYFRLEVDVDARRKVDVNVGGNLASKSISTAYARLRYQFLGRSLYAFEGSAYAGRFYTSASLSWKNFIPTATPFYWKLLGIYNRWEYLNVEELLFNDDSPSFVNRTDRFIGAETGLALGKRSHLSIRGGYINNEDYYFNTDEFLSDDQLDISHLDGLSANLTIISDRLNRKQFASAGSFTLLSVNYFRGKERHVPKSTSAFSENDSFDRQWWDIRFRREKYFGKKLAIGFLVEGVASMRPLLRNYQATLINAPTFYPLFDSQTIFYRQFRGHHYVAGGLRLVVPFSPSFDLRLEGYGFTSNRRIGEEEGQLPVLIKDDLTPDYAGASILVYHAPFGPVSLKLSYYSEEEQHWDFMFNLGFLLYNRRSINDF